MKDKEIERTYQVQKLLNGLFSVLAREGYDVDITLRYLRPYPNGIRPPCIGLSIREYRDEKF